LCQFLDKKTIRAFKSADQALSKVLDSQLKKEGSINYVLRKCHELRINLRTVFAKNDPKGIHVIPRIKFMRILQGLPLGLNQKEINEIFEHDLHFDNNGNVSYTSILKRDLFVTLDKERIDKKRSIDGGEKDLEKQKKMSDARKVVVEDLLYIDDLDLLIYTTIAPKTSTIYVSMTRKNQIKQKLSEGKGGLEVKSEAQDDNESDYPVIAYLRGHKNQDPPAILYVPESGCLLSGEKYLNEPQYKGNEEPKSNVATDPNRQFSHKTLEKESSESGYT
jgi:hypothetical protein